MTAPTHQHEHQHTDPQPHSHPHANPHDDGAAGGPLTAELAQLGPTERGTVVLDIGGDFGSLIIMTSADLAGAEIEISPVGSDAARTHIAIRERRAPGGTRWAGIFPPLPEGSYTVWNLDGTAREVVDVVGGQIAQIDWR